MGKALATIALAHGRRLRDLAASAAAGLDRGDDSHLQDFMEHRQALVDLAQQAGALDTEEQASVIHLILDLDRGLLARLEAEKARIHRELTRLGEGRRLLGSYRGAGPGSAFYLERLG